MNESSEKIVAVGHRRSWCCRSYRSLLNFLVSEFASSALQVFSNIVACQRRRLSKQVTGSGSGERVTAASKKPSDRQCARIFWAQEMEGALTAFQATRKEVRSETKTSCTCSCFSTARDAPHRAGCIEDSWRKVGSSSGLGDTSRERRRADSPQRGYSRLFACTLRPSQDTCSRFVGDLSISRRGDVMDSPLRGTGMARCQAMSGEILLGERVRQPEECQDESGEQ